MLESELEEKKEEKEEKENKWYHIFKRKNSYILQKNEFDTIRIE